MQKTIFYICVSMIVISILFSLIPNQSMQSTMKFSLNIFLIGIILVPIISSITKINFSKYNEILKKNKIYAENLNHEVENNNKKNLEQALKIVFEQNGYNDLDISIDINKDSKTTSITIKIPPQKHYKEKEIKEITKKQTGLTPKIEYF